ncbi:MAG TPA: hypothetical protein VHE35_16845 [Kofleriaceae bacterium]|nr:hypothetical protein [Kofleriaceae bacterium]
MVLCSCSAVGRPMAVGEWSEARPPEGAMCEVGIHEVDGMGPYDRVQRFDAAGHLRYETTRLTYDGRGHEEVTWDAAGAHVVRVDSYYEQDARRGDCDDEGGCDEPATRTIDHATWRWTARGDLARATSKTTEFVDDRGTGGWKVSAEHSEDHGYRRDHDVVVDTDDGLRFDAGGHPISRDHQGVGRRYRDTFEWNGDRLAVCRWMGYTQAFAYDANGRLVKQTLSRAHDEGGDTGDTVDSWTYDGAGRLVVHARDESGGREHHEWTWSYDDAGRLAHFTNGPGSTKDYTYGPGCPANLNQPALPTALRQAGLGACVRSAGYSIDTCD